MVVKRRTSAKNPAVLSHEFVIQNHADIVACLAMLFVVGLMFQMSAPISSLFIALSHNVTMKAEGRDSRMQDMVFYTTGIKDLPATFFYLLITIVMHQIIQEYGLDKINRKMHLSKAKHNRFNESGQLLAFYLMSVVWAADIMIRDSVMQSLPLIWNSYPNVHMTFMVKFFYIVQIAYWLHVFPELYFQKVKREEMPNRVKYASLYLVFIGATYALSHTRIGLCFIFLQYAPEALFHATRLLAYGEKREIAGTLSTLHTLVFAVARLASICLAVLYFFYGLSQLPKERQIVDIANGCFNSSVVRHGCLALVILLQVYLMFNYLTYFLSRRKEQGMGAGGMSNRSKKSQQEKAKERKEKKPNTESDLTEVDQDTVRHRNK